MKHVLLSALLGLVMACGQAPEGEKVEAGDAVATDANASAQSVTLNVDPNNSVVNWTGAKIVGKQHNGTIKLQSGKIMVEGDQITGGEFVIDMNSITDLDLEGDGKARLEGHLKSDDFFDVANYPTATFTIARVEPVSDNPNVTHRITGNLTMRDNTKSITIPAKVSMDESGLKAVTPEFTIDRTQWNVMYGAGVLGVAQDEIIRDELGLQVNLTASK